MFVWYFALRNSYYQMTINLKNIKKKQSYFNHASYLSESNDSTNFYRFLFS